MGLSRSVEKLRCALENAQGISEFVIVVVCDVRGFSDFSTLHESPDIAMYIKRLYLQLLTKYFPTAKFAKPTGDGLLLIFPYTEDSLQVVAKQVIGACFKCLRDFPTICEADPMINFQPPQRVGFGISRGPACCLFSGRDILDYSGHLLNLASRLKDLARPSGILIDGHFLKQVIPQNLRDRFDQTDIYIRSLAEETATSVFFSKEHVQLPESAKTPIKSPNWKTLTATITRKALGTMSGTYSLNFKHRQVSKEKIGVTLVYPSRKLEGYTTMQDYGAFKYERVGTTSWIRFDAKALAAFLKERAVKLNEAITVKIQYVAL